MSQEYHSKEDAATECMLCQLPSKGAFCCRGCEVVFAILEKKGELEKRGEHPLYKEALRSGLISGGEIKQEDAPQGERLLLEVGEMWCPACAEGISLLLTRERGVKAASVDYATDLALIIFNPKESSKERLIRFIEKLGYKAALLEERVEENRGEFWRLLFAGFLAFNVMMAEAPLYAGKDTFHSFFAWTAYLFTIPLLFYSAFPLWRGALLSLKTRRLGVEALAATSVLAAFLLSTLRILQGNSEIYLDSIAVLVAFLLWGRYLEKRASRSAKETTLKLLRSVPRRARLASGEMRLLKEIEPGERISVLMGEVIPLDGVMESGEALIDSSSLTGEPFPKLFAKGSEVKGGFRVVEGVCTVAVTKSAGESTLGALVALIEKQLLMRKPKFTLLEKIAKSFIWITFSLAACSLFFDEGAIRALSILLIACPCTIGIAIPLVEARFTALLAERGAFAKERSLLFSIAAVTDIVFDKTGTVTRGDAFSLRGLGCLTEEQALRFSALASCSRHPLSEALLKSLPRSNLAPEEVKEVVGFGIRGVVNGKRLSIGSHRFVSGEDKVSLYLEEEGELFPIEVEDALRDEMKELIASLTMYRLHLFSGDRQQAVSAVAKALGIESWRGELTPLEKQEATEKLQKSGASVLFVGDGMNDALSLASADVGVSFGRSADLTQEASSVVFLTPKLSVLREILDLAKRGKRVALENLCWSFAYNVMGMGLAFCGLLTPIYSVVAMTMSSLIVIARSELYHSRTTLPHCPESMISKPFWKSSFLKR